MNIIKLNKEKLLVNDHYISFAYILYDSKEIWLFNCSEGCQHLLRKKKIKINYISKIIITNLNIKNISGLLGLLSSLSLINREKQISIYSPQGLDKYLNFGKKYSQTNFRYNIYFYILRTGLIIHNNSYQVYTFKNNITFDLLIIKHEQFGKFQLLKAKQFDLMEGPLYGKIKKGSDFLLPDGLILNSNNFTYKNTSGIKISFISNQYHQRNCIEVSKKSRLLHCSI